MKFRLQYIPIFLIASVTTFAQQGKVYVKTSGTGSVQVKYFTRQLISTEGFNIYRSKGNSWVKLNDVPVMMRQEPDPAYAADSAYLAGCQMGKSIKPDSVQPLQLVMAAMRAVEDNRVAAFDGLFYQDETVGKAETCRYRVMQIKNGAELLVGISEQVRAGRPKSQRGIEKMKGSPGQNQATLTWLPVDSLYYAYNVYRYESMRSNRGKKMNFLPVVVVWKEDSTGHSLPNSLFTDSGLENGITYYYEVRGIDAFGEESLSSGRIGVTPLDKEFPAAPEIVTMKTTGNTVYVGWTKEKPENDFRGFNLYRSITRDSSFSKLNRDLMKPGLRMFKDEAPENKSYAYVVSAVDKAGNESFSQPVITLLSDKIPPLAPAGLRAEVTTNTVTLRWTPNRERDCIGYRVIRKKGGGETGLELRTTDLKQTFFTDSLPPVLKETYYYMVMATDSSFNLSPYSEAVSVMPVDVIPPAVPIVRSLKEAGSSFVVEWLPVTDVDIKAYIVHRSENQQGWAALDTISSTLPALAYRDSLAKAGVAYAYAVSAIDHSGNVSALSFGMNGKINLPKQLPPRPTKVSAIPDKRAGKVEIRWEIARSADLAGVIVYRRSGTGEDFIRVSALLSDVTSFRDTSLENFSNYFYEVRSYSRSGETRTSDTIIVNF